MWRGIPPRNKRVATLADLSAVGGFAVGNIVDAVYAARLKRGELRSDKEIYQRLDDIRRQCLSPYYEKLNTEGNSNEQEKSARRFTC